MEEKENRVGKPHTGKVHMIAVALNYEGTDAPLNCTVDTERLTALAAQAKVRDIVKMYDTGETEKWPSPAELEEEIRAMASRCAKGEYFVFQYSGHGANQENEDAPSGVDSVLCLRERNGEDASMVDDDVAALITEVFDPAVYVLVLADACHSGGVLDCDTPGIWGGRRVCAISGCQDSQTSVDTGDGGAMTNALLRCINRKTVRELRRRRKVSVQYVFNRMVEFMPPDEDEDDDDDDSEAESDFQGSGSDNDEDDDSESSDDGDDDGAEPGQHINLSLPGSCDPSKIVFPF